MRVIADLKKYATTFVVMVGVWLKLLQIEHGKRAGGTYTEKGLSPYSDKC